jgi:hypothetical protein
VALSCWLLGGVHGCFHGFAGLLGGVLVVWLALLLVVCHRVLTSSPLFTSSFRYVSVALLVAPFLLVSPLGGDLCFVGSVLLVARLSGDLLQWLQHSAATCVLLAWFCWWLDSAVTAMECSVLQLLPACAPNAACYTSWPRVQWNAAQRATLLGRGCNAMQRATLVGRVCTCATPVLGGRVLCYTFAILISLGRVVCLHASFILMFQQCTNLFFYFRLVGSPRTNHHDHWTYSCCR